MYLKYSGTPPYGRPLIRSPGYYGHFILTRTKVHSGILLCQKPVVNTARFSWPFGGWINGFSLFHGNLVTGMHLMSWSSSGWVMLKWVHEVMLGTVSNHDGDGDRNENGKKQKNKNNIMALHVRYTFHYISLRFSAKHQRGMVKFNVLWRTWAHGGECSLLRPNLNLVLTNSALGKLAYGRTWIF